MKYEGNPAALVDLESEAKRGLKRDALQLIASLANVARVAGKKAIKQIGRLCYRGSRRGVGAGPEDGQLVESLWCVLRDLQ